MPRPLKRPEQPIDPYKAQALPVTTQVGEE